ncbi:histidinol-phosphatase HisJ [Weissella cibaria]|uniref:histidinol-phosphatase HisJ n=1 Tax=Weissella cibaria TaxID=137591 RepID=UPI0021AE4A4F|nr:histidinol-phosphatase HisJ [Weissella cibaria]MCT0958139.1 histidinol-phosphatase HisJ [Weissella cibaria]
MYWVKKKDGHTHTNLSHHGSDEDVEQYIQKAIQLGFSEYVITEHAPLPERFIAQSVHDESYLAETAMAAGEINRYFERVQQLKRKYEKEIQIIVGLEVDYLVGFEQKTQELLTRYDDVVEEIVLSVHFIPSDKQALAMIDGSPDILRQHFQQQLRQPQQLFQNYFQTVLQSVTFPFTTSAKIRIGHMTLINKFQDTFEWPVYDDETLAVIDELLFEIKKVSYELDYNAAGLYKPLSNSAYPTIPIVVKALQLGISLVYGSDAHMVMDVGHGYHQLVQTVDWLNED